MRSAPVSTTLTGARDALALCYIAERVPGPKSYEELRPRAGCEMQEIEMAGLYYEEFEIGRVFRHPLTRTVTEMDNTMFSLLTMNPQPLHLDAHFSAKTEYGQRLFNSLYTLGIMIGMTVYDTTLGTTAANLGMSEVNFPKPVFHGDTLRATTEVLSKRESKSRPDVGLVEFAHACLNQDDVVVATCRRMAMMRKRPA